ncbi:MAG TPA: DinB family protein [Dehalococcoidia bacterium]|jgi:hypothetical protein
MSKADLIKQQLGITRMIFDGTMADVTDSQCAKLPGGVAHPIGATFAHSVMSEDFVVNMMVKGGQPLMMGPFANKTGVSEPQPMPGGDVFAWAQRVKVDLPALRQYAQAVHKATDEYVAGLSDEDLDRKIDFVEMGPTPISSVLTMVAIVHPSNHIGEVSALKGMEGAKGYPF